MNENIALSLLNYEKDFVSFQKQLPKLRETNPNEFIAIKDDKVISSGNSVETIVDQLNSKGIEPSGTIIEFVSKDIIRVIV